MTVPREEAYRWAVALYRAYCSRYGCEPLETDPVLSRIGKKYVYLRGAEGSVARVDMVACKVIAALVGCRVVP